MKRLFQTLRGIIGCVVLSLTVLLSNLLQCCSILIWPFSANGFRRTNRFIANTWWGLCAFFIEDISKIWVHITGDSLPQKENALLIINHQSIADIPVLFSLGRDQHMLGDMKWFVKDIVKYIPGPGWGMLFLDCLFVKRDWYRDKSSIRKTFDKFNQHQAPLWLINFPEGTRFTEEKKLKSQKFAKKRNQPILNNVLLPRTKGVIASIQGLREHVKVLYDISIHYPQEAPTLFQFITGRTKEITLHVNRFPLDQLPETDKELSNWVMERFQIKDKWLDDQQFPPENSC